MFKTIATTLVACAAAATLSALTPAPKKPMSAATQKQTMMAKPTARKDTPASLRREAKISEKTARATALKEVPNGKIKASELERENGNLIWSFDIKVAGKSGIEEITVNAVTGAVVTHEHETPKTEKKEAAAEKKEKK
ncbi:MAG: PepSY domain-containing protein [Gemmatimonadaceae bacterium]